MNRDAIRDAIAKLWSVETLCPINKPKFQIISLEKNRCLTLNVGRVSLECCRKNVGGVLLFFSHDILLLTFI